MKRHAFPLGEQVKLASSLIIPCQQFEDGSAVYEAEASPEKRHLTPHTDAVRDPARIRVVFDTSVAIAKSMNPARKKISSAKRRAEKLGLKVDLQAAGNLHWKSIQARPPALLVAGPSSPPRTPRRPALEYPSAERSVIIYPALIGNIQY